MGVRGVNVFGPVEVASGLGTAVRGHLRAMWAAGLRTRVFPFRFTRSQGSQPLECPEEKEFFHISIVYANADGTDFIFSRYGREIRRSGYRIGVWVWELAAAREEHVPSARAYDEIWVPSSFNHRAFSAVMKTPVHIVPYVVEVPVAAGDGFRRRLGIPAAAFVYLYMFDASSYIERKNPMVLLRAFRAEFAGDADAYLVLKISHLDGGSAFAGDLDRAQRVSPNIKVVRDTLDDSGVAALLDSADCYVSPHRTEGFGFTLAEAMAIGKPVVATDYGSTRDFVTVDTAFPVACRLVEVGRDLGPYRSGAVWAEPSEAALRREMRRVREDTEERALRAGRGRELVRRRFSAAAVGALIMQRIGSAGASAHG